MKTILTILLCAITCAASGPPAPLGFRVTYKPAPKRGAELLIAKTAALKTASAWVMPVGTFTTTPIASRFAPATADATLRPLTITYTPNGDGTVTVCIETVQNALETIAFQYSQNLIGWSAGRPLEPDPSGARRVALCFSDHAASLPAQLFFRVRSL